MFYSYGIEIASYISVPGAFKRDYEVKDEKTGTGSCEKIPACLNLPAFFLPTNPGSQCTAHQP